MLPLLGHRSQTRPRTPGMVQIKCDRFIKWTKLAHQIQSKWLANDSRHWTLKQHRAHLLLHAARGSSPTQPALVDLRTSWFRAQGTRWSDDVSASRETNRNRHRAPLNAVVGVYLKETADWNDWHSVYWILSVIIRLTKQINRRQLFPLQPVNQAFVFQMCYCQSYMHHWNVLEKPRTFFYFCILKMQRW